MSTRRPACWFVGEFLPRSRFASCGLYLGGCWLGRADLSELASVGWSTVRRRSQTRRLKAVWTCLNSLSSLINCWKRVGKLDRRRRQQLAPFDRLPSFSQQKLKAPQAVRFTEVSPSAKLSRPNFLRPVSPSSDDEHQRTGNLFGLFDDSLDLAVRQGRSVRQVDDNQGNAPLKCGPQELARVAADDRIPRLSLSSSANEPATIRRQRHDHAAQELRRRRACHNPCRLAAGGEHSRRCPIHSCHAKAVLRACRMTPTAPNDKGVLSIVVTYVRLSRTVRLPNRRARSEFCI